MLRLGRGALRHGRAVGAVGPRWTTRSASVVGASVVTEQSDADDEHRARIRNFSIIAHVDHGKSTLADRLMEKTATVSDLGSTKQLLDDMDLEKEKGITIKMRSVRMNYKYQGINYQLNLIDTPGHVDFSYEVSRSLAAVEGAILVVDASQGVQAQTMANVDLAIENDLEIFPVLNKIDLPHAEPERVMHEIDATIGISGTEAILISAKKGLGIDEVLSAVIDRIPPPDHASSLPLRALVFDSFYDVHRGVVVFVRIKGGTLKKGDRVRGMAMGAEYVVEEVGIFKPKMVPVADGLRSGEVGYLVCGVRKLRDLPVGDTVTHAGPRGATEPLPGYQEVKPMVYFGLYPVNGDDVTKLCSALEKLRLNDASLVFEPDHSGALGSGFRCGFLGLLHKEIVCERLFREYNVEVITSKPSVSYRVTTRNGVITDVASPHLVPHDAKLIEEPFVNVDVIFPSEFTQNMYRIFTRARRGKMVRSTEIGGGRVQMAFELPLSEVVTDLHNAVKSNTKGYGSMDYHYIGMRAGSLVRLDLSVAGEDVESLSYIVPQEAGKTIGKELCVRLRGLLKAQQFDVLIQAKLNGKAVASEKVKSVRKDVTAKCYGGDVTRKRKLLEKQKAGKKKLLALGRVNIPMEAYQAMVSSMV